MVIQNNASTNMNVSLRNYSINSTKLHKNTEKLASGYKINRSADDAAGLAVSVLLSAQATGVNRTISNARDGINMVQASDAALTEIDSMLNRMTYLSTQAANGLYGDGERAALQAEMDNLTSEIDRIANTSNFNGVHTLNGQDSPVQLNVSQGGGEDSMVDMPSMDVRSGALGLDGLRLDSSESALASLSKIRDALSTVSDAHGSLGATQNRLDHAINSLSVYEENLTATIANIRDTDYAEQMMNQTRFSLLNSASQAMSAQANQNAYSVLRLIQG